MGLQIAHTVHPRVHHGRSDDEKQPDYKNEDNNNLAEVGFEPILHDIDENSRVYRLFAVRPYQISHPIRDF